MGKKNTLKNFWVRLESASSTVTGSLIYLKPNFPNGKKEPELVFDCGTFLDSENKKYNEDFPCKPANIYAVFITHEHVDHMGRLAGFYNQGYKGKVFASEYAVQVIKSEAIKNYFFTMKNNEEPKHEEKDAISLINGCVPIKIGEIINIDDLKTRLFGNKVYVDLEVQVDGNDNLRHAHAIAHQVHDLIENNFPTVKHCNVHVNPSDS